jgi:hypothetical protein
LHTAASIVRIDVVLFAHDDRLIRHYAIALYRDLLIEGPYPFSNYKPRAKVVSLPYVRLMLSYRTFHLPKSSIGDYVP